MRLPTYRSSHGLRHHPYPQSKRTLARNTFVKPVDRYDEVSTRAQALELSDVQRLDATTDNFEVALYPNRDFGNKARRICLSTLVVDLALILKRKYFT